MLISFGANLNGSTSNFGHETAALSLKAGAIDSFQIIVPTLPLRRKAKSSTITSIFAREKPHRDQFASLGLLSTAKNHFSDIFWQFLLPVYLSSIRRRRNSQSLNLSSRFFGLVMVPLQCPRASNQSSIQFHLRAIFNTNLGYISSVHRMYTHIQESSDVHWHNHEMSNV
jgi:hypothetical protein